MVLYYQEYDIKFQPSHVKQFSLKKNLTLRIYSHHTTSFAQILVIIRYLKLWIKLLCACFAVSSFSTLLHLCVCVSRGDG
jgi:hypothetical protein